jgi:hypothetical protein
MSLHLPPLAHLLAGRHNNSNSSSSTMPATLYFTSNSCSKAAFIANKIR